MCELIIKTMPAGTTIHLGGIPMSLVRDTEVNTLESNYKLATEQYQSVMADKNRSGGIGQVSNSSDIASKRKAYWQATALEEQAIRSKKTSKIARFLKWLPFFASPQQKDPFLCCNKDGKTYEVTPTTLGEGLIIYLSDGRMAVLSEEVNAYVYSKEEHNHISTSE